MPQITEIGDGSKTVFSLPVHNKTATATVNGSGATLSSQSDQSVTFAAAPAAGSTVVITYTAVAANASTSTSSTQDGAVDSVSASLNRYLSSSRRTPKFSNASMTALRAYHFPFYVEQPITINGAAVNVVTGAASSVTRVGLYARASTGYIGNLIVSTGDLDTSSTGTKTATFADTVLQPGWYFVTVVSNGTPTLLGYTSSETNMIGISPFGFNSAMTPIEYRYEALASAVLPSTPSATTTAGVVGITNPPAGFLIVK